VELVLPAAHYVVRMLDGRIDSQGTVAELRASGVLEGIASMDGEGTGEQQEAGEEMPAEVAAEAAADEDVTAGSSSNTETPAQVVVDAKQTAKAAIGGKKKPRKLVETEKREEGSVKWAIYNTYLKAS
jgi:hypothetical protein